MSKITLEVNEKHLSDVLVILKSLKNGMITTLHVENKTSAIKEKYKEPIKNSETNSSRYLSPQQFKQKLSKEKS